MYTVHVVTTKPQVKPIHVFSMIYMFNGIKLPLHFIINQNSQLINNYFVANEDKWELTAWPIKGSIC